MIENCNVNQQLMRQRCRFGINIYVLLNLKNLKIFHLFCKCLDFCRNSMLTDIRFCLSSFFHVITFIPERNPKKNNKQQNFINWLRIWQWQHIMNFKVSSLENEKKLTFLWWIQLIRFLFDFSSWMRLYAWADREERTAKISF